MGQVREKTGLMFAVALAALIFSLAPLSYGQQSNTIPVGIRLFQQGQTDAALTVFNELVKQNPHCPLVYYYAAWIRIQKQQYARARQNLEAALRDSAAFNDAQALLAVALRGEGNGPAALDAWNRFVQGAGTIAGETKPTLESITFPDIYRQRRAEQARATLARDQAAAAVSKQNPPQQAAAPPKTQEPASPSPEPGALGQVSGTPGTNPGQKPPVQTGSPANTVARAPVPAAPAAQAVANPAQAAKDTISVSNAGPDSLTDTGYRTIPERVITIADTPLREIESRISADIRTILVTVSLAAGFCLLSVVSVILWIRKKHRKSDDAVFSEQVERLLDDLQFEVGESRALSEFEKKRRDIMKELESIRAEKEPPQTPLPVPLLIAPEETVSRERMFAPAVFREKEEQKRPVITEEVKTLVSRLYREGRPVEEIARAADLTTTEVRLILTIREHKLAHLAVELHGDDRGYETDQLLTAVQTLREEGMNAREIARKLAISLSEVELVKSMLLMRGQRVDPFS